MFSRSAALMVAALAAFASSSFAQAVDPAAAMQWRHIGPDPRGARAGRRRRRLASRTSPTSASTTAASGARPTTARTGRRSSTASRPARSAPSRSPRRTPTSSTWAPARASSGRTCRRATGSTSPTDAGRTWTHLGLADSQMIANIDVDPRESRPLLRRGPRPPLRPERGARRLPLDRRGEDVPEGAVQGRVHERERRAHRPVEPGHRLCRALGAAGRVLARAREFGGPGGGIFKSIDGGTTWKPLTDGLPDVVEANLAIAPSNPTVSTRSSPARRAGASGPAAASDPRGTIASTSPPTPASTGSWRRTARMGAAPAHPDPRPLARIGGGDLPTLAVDPKNENASTAARSCSGGRRTAASPGARSAARPAATTTRRCGSTRTTRTSWSWSPTRARSSRPTAARAGATGIRSRPARCTT